MSPLRAFSNLVVSSFQDLAMYINEVKRDKETLKKISEFQSSIENLVNLRTILELVLFFSVIRIFDFAPIPVL